MKAAQSCPTLCDPWTVAYQDPPSMGFFRQEYWSGLSFPSPGDLPKPGIKPASPHIAGGFFTNEPPDCIRGNLLPAATENKYIMFIFLASLPSEVI